VSLLLWCEGADACVCVREYKAKLKEFEEAVKKEEVEVVDKPAPKEQPQPIELHHSGACLD
jgi:hypothetical protein